MKIAFNLWAMAMGCCLLASGLAAAATAATATTQPGLALEPAPVLSPPPAQYAGDKRIFQGIPGIERAPKGRLWVTWHGG